MTAHEEDLTKVNPFDLLSGKVIQHHLGTYWFKEAGQNTVSPDGTTLGRNLYREDGPVYISKDGLFKLWFKDGRLADVENNRGSTKSSFERIAETLAKNSLKYTGRKVK